MKYWIILLIVLVICITCFEMFRQYLFHEREVAEMQREDYFELKKLEMEHKERLKK